MDAKLCKKKVAANGYLVSVHEPGQCEEHGASPREAGQRAGRIARGGFCQIGANANSLEKVKVFERKRLNARG